MSSMPFPQDRRQNLPHLSHANISSSECSPDLSFLSDLPALGTAFMPHSPDPSNSYSYPKLHTITTASHRMLIDLGNVAYTQLYQRCARLEEELTQAKTEKNNAVIERDTYKNAYAVLAGSIPSTISTTSMNPLHHSFSPLLSVAQPPPSVHDQNWPKVSDFSAEELKKIYWYKSAWTAHLHGIKGLSSLDIKKGSRGRTRASVGINVQMLYVVDREGTPVDGHRAGVMRATARSIWSQLSDAGMAPVKWMSDQNLAVGEHYRSEMRQRFEELRICENGWKVDQIAIDYYPSWRTSQQSRGNFNGNKENVVEVISDSEDDIVSNSTVLKKREKKTPNTQESKRRKCDPDVKHVKIVPAVTKIKENTKVKLVNPLANVLNEETDATVDLGSTNPARPRPRPVAITTATTTPGQLLASTSSAITSPPVSTASSAITSPPVSTASSATTSPPVSTASSATDSTSSAMDWNSSDTDSTSLATHLTSSATDSTSSTMGSTSLATGSASLATGSLSSPKATPSESLNSSKSSDQSAPGTEKVPDSTTHFALPAGETASPEAHPLPRMLNLKIRIPAQPPVKEIPAITTKKNTTRIPAYNKPIAPGDKPTARNFCIRDWCAAHPGGTQGEFKGYWDGLTGIDKKEYQEMEKKAKGKR